MAESPWRRRRAAIARRRAPLDIVDLTNDSAFTLALLDDTWAWRHRLVEELDLGSSDHVEVTSSYQLEFPPELVAPYIGDRNARYVKALVPITTREKRPLLRFSVTGPGFTQAHLIRRVAIAAISADYLSRLVASSPARAEAAAGLTPKLLEAVCITTPAIFREFLANHPTHPGAVAAYLSDGLGFAIDSRMARRWAEQQADVGATIAAALREPPDSCSSAEQVILALPRLEPRPRDVAEVDAVLVRYRRAVLAAAQARDRSLLVALGDYGRRYELILELEAPLDEPFTVKMSEQRPLELRRRGWTYQRSGLRDARGYHFEARVNDHSMEIAAFSVHDSAELPVGIPPLEAARFTSESLALYSSDPERPSIIVIGLRLRTTADVRATLAFVAVLAWMAVAAAVIIRPEDESNLVDALNLLTVPTTFAVALVLFREATSLSARLQRYGRVLLALAIALLWSIELGRLILQV